MWSSVALVQPNRAMSSTCRDNLWVCCSLSTTRFSLCFVALNEPTVVQKSGPDLLRGGLYEAVGHSRHHSRHTTRRAAGVVRQPAGAKHGFFLKRRVCRCPPSVSAANDFAPHCCVHTPYWASQAPIFLSMYVAAGCRRTYLGGCKWYRRPNGGWRMPPQPFTFRFGLLPRRPDDESRAGLQILLG